ncbi:MAG: hypothetical protein KKF41_02805 [Actinobacteria bacterium]|nr:hypothetical protein [Actinomycetota bacterium]MBU1945298.1 hypothetical protein [Actinomycetota bacterium]MBU2686498.1 hypothetical protein [Actinomycetota bacterium]
MNVSRLSCRVAVILLIALLVSLLSSTACLAWTIQPTGVQGHIYAISALDANHVYAVGYNTTDNKPLTLIYDGTSWSGPAAVVPPEETLFGVSAVDSTHVWAVGGTDTTGTVRMYNGTSWSGANPITTKNLRGVTSVDNSHVWAVGGGGEIWFYNGAAWSQQPSGTTEDLYGVYALDASHVWAVGNHRTVRFFDGAFWGDTGVLPGGEIYWTGVYASDPDSVWLVGGKGTGTPAEALHYDGSGWGTSEFGEQCYTLRAVSGTDANHVWAAGDLGTLVFFDGSRWTKQFSSVPGEVLLGVSALDDSHVWACGGGGRIIFDQPGAYRYYFAEGTTREGFEEWLCLQNPGAAPIEVRATYMLFGGPEPIEKVYTMPAASRLSVSVNDEVGPGQDVSATLQSDAEFYAERPMYFDYKSGVPGYGWTGGHCAKGARNAMTDWYFAEGTTRAGFEEWLCLQNPNGADVTVDVDYISAGAYTRTKQYGVPANSRSSIFVNGEVGGGQDVSMHIRCEAPVVAERPMYFDYGDVYTGGHVVMGTDSPRGAWFFAEGTTRPGYVEYLAVQNPNALDAAIQVTFFPTGGDPIFKEYSVPADSRWTLDVSQAVGTGVDSSMLVLSHDVPVIAERPMYFSYRQGEPGYSWTGGHDVVGATEPGTHWAFAEGCTIEGFDEYICIANPGEDPARVAMEFMVESGQVFEHDIEVGAGNRVTVDVTDIVPRGHSVSTLLTSDQPVVAERPMYFNYQGAWTGGHDVVGF